MTASLRPHIPALCAPNSSLLVTKMIFGSTSIGPTYPRAFSPQPSFFVRYSRWICSSASCRWASHRRYTSCQRSIGDGHCGSPLISPITISESLPTRPSANSQMPSVSSPPSLPYRPSLTSQQALDFAVQAATNLHLDDEASGCEQDCVNAIFEDIISAPIRTVSHIPRSVCPLLAEILASELHQAANGNIWASIRLFMLPKATLGLPTKRNRSRSFSASSTIRTQLLQWQAGNISQLWCTVTSQLRKHQSSAPMTSVQSSNLKRALHKGREGHYGKAIQALQSHGIALPSNANALADLQKRHSQGTLPTPMPHQPIPFIASPEMVRTCLLNFPKDSSPGSSSLRIQHLTEPILNCSAPASQDCLLELTRWLNHLLSGKGNPLLAPWLCGAPLTALHKKDQRGFRPIAVGEVLRRLASKLCCLYIKGDLPQFFLPYGQLGVGTRGGLEAAIHATRLNIERFKDSPDMCLLKIDFQNAFNECSRQVILDQIASHFSELFAWTQWCYGCASELQFGPHRILSTSGVQQGDPMGPLLFSLAYATYLMILELARPPQMMVPTSCGTWMTVQSSGSGIKWSASTIKSSSKDQAMASISTLPNASFTGHLGIQHFPPLIHPLFDSKMGYLFLDLQSGARTAFSPALLPRQ